MPIEPLRDIAKYGVLCDPDPYSLPDTAWSFGVNVRFRNDKITGGPVWRNAFTLGTASIPATVSLRPQHRASTNSSPATSTASSTSSTAPRRTYTLAGYTPSSTDGIWTSTALASILYVNRNDRAPWYLRASDSAFQNLGVVSGGATTWDNTYSCNVLRTCAGALVALNVTKAGTNFPTMVKTSSIPLSGVVPTSWDITTANTLATENILSEMKGPITDGQNLGNALVIYGLQEAWMMQADGSIQVYNYRKLPFQKGALSANCSLEIDGRHYVFGTDDIWMHDGNTEVSIVDGKNRDFIFSSINMSKKNRCFVQHNPQLKEIAFCYISGDKGVAFLGEPDGCNRAYVYNYVEKTASFDDLPLVFSASNANLSVTQTYATTTATYDTTGGSYLDQEDGFKRTPVYVGTSSTKYSLGTTLYGLDLFGAGSTLGYPVDTNATQPRYLERDGIDLDTLNVELRGYKVLSSIFPQARLGDSAANLTFSVGASDQYNVPPVYSTTKATTASRTTSSTTTPQAVTSHCVSSSPTTAR
jgi:hypothetical protein